MTTVSINASNLTTKYIRDNLANVHESIGQLASGNKFLNPGQGVAEKSIARSIALQLSSGNIAKDNIVQAENIMDSAYAIVENTKNGLQRQYELAMTASSDTLTNQREFLQIEFSNITQQIDNNATFKYNGLTLLDGSFSGAPSIKTQLGEVPKYDITNINQYNVYGNVGENRLITQNSHLSITGLIGETQASGSLTLNSKIVDGDKIIINGTTVTARDIVTNSATEFQVGPINQNTLENLVDFLNASDNIGIRNASYRYSSNLGENKNLQGISIIHNSAGSAGNSFTISSTGANVNASKNLTGGADKNSDLSQTTFDQSLHGTAGKMYAIFDHDSERKLNTVKIFMQLDNNIYSTESIVLGMDGTGGYESSGNKIAKGTQLFFSRVGAKSTDVGFMFNFGDQNVVLNSTASIFDAQAELNEMMNEVTNAIQGIISVGINAPVTIEKNFGLNSIADFSSSGNIISNASHLENSITFTDKIGSKSATGIIKIDTYNAKINETLVVNGTSLVFGTDIAIGATNADTRNNLLAYLNNSADANISAATYSIIGTDSILVTSKNSGSAGNKMMLSTDSDSISFNNSSPFKKSANLGENFNGLHSVFTKAKGALTFTANAADGNTLTVNGTTVTFKTTASNSAGQVAIGSNMSDTIANLVTFLNASTDANIAKATYSIDSTTPTKINVTYDTYGETGNSFTLATTATGITLTNVTGGSFIEVPTAGLAATGKYKFTANPAANDTVTLGGTAITFVAANPTGNQVLIGPDAEDTAKNLLAFLQASTDVNLAKANYELDVITDPSKPTINITYKTVGNAGNGFTIASSGAGILVTSMANGYEANSFTNNIALGTDASNSIVSFDPGLKGKISNISATFNEGSVSALGNQFTSNSVTISGIIGGEVYSGTVLLSGGSASGSSATGTNYNKLGHLLAPNSKIMLTSADSTHAVVLTLDSEGIDLTDTSKVAIQRKLSDFASQMEEALYSINITQKRIVANFDESKVLGTVLSGLTQRNVKIIDEAFDENGMGAKIGKFSVDSYNNTISVKINDVLYSQKLSDSMSNGGLSEHYDSINKVIMGGANTVIKLTTGVPNDSRALIMNLQDVANISINTDKEARNLEEVLNNAFGARDSNSLTFQVGTTSKEIASLELEDMSSRSVYKDINGASHTNLDISTKVGAQNALEVISNALNYVNTQMARIGSLRNQFSAISSNLNSLMDSMKTSYSNLLDADLSIVSGNIAKNMLKVNTSATAQLHENNMLKELVSTIMRG